MINGLPDRLRALRKKHNLTPKNVAIRLHLSPSIISSYETGDRTPSPENLLALSHLYQCSTDYLLGRDTTDPALILEVDGLEQEQIQALTMLISTLRKK